MTLTSPLPTYKVGRSKWAPPGAHSRKAVNESSPISHIVLLESLSRDGFEGLFLCPAIRWRLPKETDWKNEFPLEHYFQVSYRSAFIWAWRPQCFNDHSQLVHMRACPLDLQVSLDFLDLVKRASIESHIAGD